jgi:hypothetical protein
MIADDSLREHCGHVAASNNPCKQTVFCPYVVRVASKVVRSMSNSRVDERRARRRCAGAWCARVLDLEVKSHFASNDCVSLRR